MAQAFDTKKFTGMTHHLHHLESVVYERQHAGQISSENTEVLLRCVNSMRVVQTFFQQNADEDGLLPMNTQNEAYFCEAMLKLQLVHFLLGTE